jgi:hypothetical protein
MVLRKQSFSSHSLFLSLFTRINQLRSLLKMKILAISTLLTLSAALPTNLAARDPQFAQLGNALGTTVGSLLSIPIGLVGGITQGVTQGVGEGIIEPLVAPWLPWNWKKYVEAVEAQSLAASAPPQEA